LSFPVKQQFLSWQEPVLTAATSTLLAQARATGKMLDLQHLLVVVPTRHAGRRLREAMAVQAHGQGAAVLPPRLLTPEALIAGDDTTANPAEVLAIWAKLIEHLDFTQFPQLFPLPPTPDSDSFAWALGVAGQIIELRELLGGNGILLNEMPTRLQALAVPDAQWNLPRWQELAALEQQYLTTLQHHGLYDLQHWRRRQADSPPLPEGIEQIMLVATPDPLPLAIHALQQLRQHLPITVLIHAPAALANHFDSWGRPLAELWCERPLDLEDAAIHLLADADEQAQAVAQLLTAEITPTQLSVGVADQEVIAHLQHESRRRQIATFDPAGMPLVEHALLQLLTDLLRLIEGGDNYEALSRLLRHPQLRRYLQRQWPRRRFDTAALLTQLDTLQNQHLPTGFVQVQQWLQHDSGNLAELRFACTKIEHLQQQLLPPASFGVGILHVLQELYAGQPLQPNLASDRLLAEAAARLRSFVEQLDQSVVSRILVRTNDRHRLLLRLLANLRYFPEPEKQEAALPLLGWLELHWTETPYLVITGMNEGKVPEAVVGHPFLPDQSRRLLGLPHNQQRLARDVYLLSAMLAWRHGDNGQLRLLLGKSSRQGDVLKPSRLLFNCTDAQLPARAAQLFAAVTPAAAAVPRSIVWKLAVPALPPPEHLAVTAFRDYLACPLRFYLKRVIGMQPLHDRKSELNAADFGNLCHQALQALAQHPLLRASTDADAIAAYLENMVQSEMQRQYGPRLSMALQVQAQSLRQRLRAAARIQAEQSAAGWMLLQGEVSLGDGEGILLHGMRIRGRLDRIERHRDGRIRILDYKTSDVGSSPLTAHMCRLRSAENVPEYAVFSYNGDTWRWLDLQLPLYALLLQQQYHSPLSVGFFTLPRAVSETAVLPWQLEPELLAAAAHCAAGIVDAVRAGKFWPPAAHVAYDDFAALFCATAAESVDPKALLT